MKNNKSNLYMLISLAFLVLPVLAHGADVVGFRHSTSNAAASAAYIVGAVNANVKDGVVQFKNDRYDAVIAYIHDKNGNIVDKVVIPGAVDSTFTAAASAVRDTIPAFISGQRATPLREYFQNGSAMVLDSTVSVQKFPEGGAISYVSGTPAAILATVGSGVIKSFTAVISAGSTKPVSDSVVKNIMKDVLYKAVEDPDLLSKTSMLMAGNKTQELGSVVFSWLATKGRQEAVSSFAKQGFPVDSGKITSLLDVGLKPLETLSNGLTASSAFRDAFIQSKAGPKVLWFDMPYDSNDNLSPQSNFNWLGTPLAKHDQVVFTPTKNEKDYSAKWWNPLTWGDKFQAEYDRYHKVKISSVKSGPVTAETYQIKSGGYTPPKLNLASTSTMQNQLTAITTGGTSHIGSAVYFMGRSPSVDTVRENQHTVAHMGNPPIFS